MANHVISIDLRLLNNNLNQQVNGLLGNIGNSFGGVNKTLHNNLFGNNGAFNINVWDRVFNAISSIGVGAFRAINGEIQRSIQYQNNLIATATSFQGILGLSYKESTALARQSNVVFQRQNALLPFQRLGQSLRASYGDDILGTFYDPRNVTGSLERTAGLLGRLQVILGGTSGTTNFQQTSFLSNVLSDTYKRVTRLEVFRNNPLLQRSFNAEVEGIGGESAFNKLNRNDRIKLLERVANNALSDDVIESYTNTLGGIFGRLSQRLTGDLGIFSFTRDLIPILPNSNIITSLTGFFKELFATDGIFGSAMAALQGSVDGILLGIKVIFDGATLILKPINLLFKALQPLNPLIYGLSAALTVLATVGIARSTASAIRGILIQSGASVLGGNVGSLLSLGLTPGALGGAGLASSLGGIVNGIKGLTTLGWASVVSGFNGLAGGVAAFGKSLWVLAVNPVFWVIAGIVAAIGLAGYTIWKYWKPLSAFFGGFWEGFLEGIQPAIGAVNIFAEAWKIVVEVMKPVGDLLRGINEAFQPLVSSTATFFNLEQEEASQSNASTGRRIGRSFGSGLQAPFRLLGILNPFDIIDNVGKVYAANSATGNYNSLFAAVDREMKAMPSGASLRIANDSEMIIPRGGKSPNSNFNVTINVNGGGNSQAIASDITQALDNWWQSVQSAY